MPDVLVASLFLLLAASVQSFFGFGFGIIAMSALTLSHDLVHASGVVNLAAILLSGAIVWREHRRMLWPLLWRVVPAMLVGIAIGLAALQSLDRGIMVRVLGVTIVAVSAWNLASPRLRARESARIDAAVGFVAGLLSGAFNTGGPPLVVHLYRRPEAPAVLVVTLQGIFLCSALVRAVLSTAQGLIDAEIAWVALIGAPFVLFGVWLGRGLAGRVAPERFRRVAWLALGGLGLALLFSA